MLLNAVDLCRGRGVFFCVDVRQTLVFTNVFNGRFLVVRQLKRLISLKLCRSPGIAIVLSA
jgi:hypothetical protein